MLGVLQHGFKQRDPRIKVLLPARMKVGQAWADACIHNVSSHGMLVASDQAPTPGTYVDIRRGQNVIIGRAIWRKDRFFGVRTQDGIDLAALKRDPAHGAPRRDPGMPNTHAERRRDSRDRKDAVAARTLERSRAISRLMEFGLIAFVAIAAAVMIGHTVYGELVAPFSDAKQAMLGEN